MLIRPATWRDTERITDLFGKMCDEIAPTPAIREEYNSPENIFLNIAARIKLPAWHIVVIENVPRIHETDPYGVNKKIIGFMMSELRWPRYNNCHVIGAVEALYVVPAHRGNGLYARMIEDSVVWGAKNNVREIEFVSSYEPHIMNFYDKLGYRPVQVVYRKKEA